MKHHTYTPSGVCSRQIDFDYENGHIYNLKYVGGCNGNLKAIGKLVEGMEIEEVIKRLAGNTCGPRKTSCADQLTKALKEVL